jgi:hypothetical protein
VETGVITRIPDPTQSQEKTALRKPGIAAWKKWLGAAVLAVVVSQFYYFRELAAALLIFTILFLMFASIAGVIYLVGRASQKGLSMAEPAARRGLVLAEVISRKTFHRPRSAPVQ